MLRVYLLASFVFASAPAFAAQPVSVMVVGTYHMSNPDRDIHDVQSDDVLTPKRQAELAAVSEGLARFHPTVVDVEWPADLVTTRYDAYVKGTLAPSKNEVVQVGFRLAKSVNAAIHGVDVDGEFPYDPVDAYANAHGQSDILASADSRIVSQIAETNRILQTGTIGQTLRFMNDPAANLHGNDFYRTMLRIGGGAQQPGADLLTAWYRRNFYICANILQLSKPGDRIVVL